MDRDLGKRKAPQEHSDDIRNSKLRRTNSQELSTEKNKNYVVNSNKKIEKLVSFWTAGGNIHPLVAQEGMDVTQLKEAEEKCFEADKIVTDLRKKLITSEKNVANLNIALKQEGIEKQDLVSKMNSTWELIRTITQHVTYATDTLGDCQKHMTYLDSTYNDVILKLQGDNEELNQRLSTIASERNANAEEVLQQLSVTEAELKNMKSKCDILESQIAREKDSALNSIEELNKNKKKLMELEVSEKKYQMIIVELENKIISQMAKVENICVMEQDKLNQTCQKYENELSKLRNELAEAHAQQKHIELERDDVFRTLVEKERTIEALEKKADSYNDQMKELKDMIDNASHNLDRFNDEKAQWETQLQAKNKEVIKVLEDLNSVTLMRNELENQVTLLNEKLNSERREKLDLQRALCENRTLAQESSERVEELKEKLDKDSEDKRNMEYILAEKNSQIEDLIRKIQNLENEHKREIKNQSEKYERCLSDLNKMSSTLANTSKLDESSRDECERFKNRFFEEKQEKEKVQEKLKKCEDMLAKKTNAEAKKKSAEQKQKEQAQEKLKKCEEMLAKKINDEAQLLEKFNKLQANYTETKKKHENMKKSRIEEAKAIDKKLSNLSNAINTQMPAFNPNSMKKNYLQGIPTTANQIVPNGSQESSNQKLNFNSPNLSVSQRVVNLVTENSVPNSPSNSIIEVDQGISKTRSYKTRTRTRGGQKTATRVLKNSSRISQVPPVDFKKKIPPASVTKPILKSCQNFKDPSTKSCFDFDMDLEFEKPDALANDIKFDELLNSPRIPPSKLKSCTPSSISQQMSSSTSQRKFFKSRESQLN